MPGKHAVQHIPGEFFTQRSQIEPTLDELRLSKKVLMVLLRITFEKTKLVRIKQIKQTNKGDMVMNLCELLNKTLTMAVVLSISLLTACGGGGGGPGAGGGSSDVSTMATAIVGDWESTCINMGLGAYLISNETYGADGSFSSHNVFYSDVSCSTVSGMVVDNAGTYTLGSDVMTSSSVTAVELDIAFTSASINGVPSSVSGDVLDIVYIDGSDHLYGGVSEEAPGSTAYPTDIDYSHYSTRVTGGDGGATGTAADMIGTWHTECLYDQDRSTASSIVYSFHQITFNNSGGFTVQLVDYSDPACNDSTDYIWKDVLEGNYTLGGDLVTPSGKNATQLILTVTSSTISGATLSTILYGMISFDSGVMLGDFTDVAYPTDFDLSNPFNHYTSGTRPVTGTCTAYDIPGEPDILDDITLSSSTVSAGNNLTVNVPVDADTGYVIVALFDTSDGSLGGLGTTTLSTSILVPVQTVPVTVPTSTVFGSAVVGHQYEPSVSVCTDSSSCNFIFTPSGSGMTVHYSYDSADPFRLDRGKNYDNGAVTRVSHPSCIVKPVLNVVP